MTEIPPFSPLSEAIMAALASRSHEWLFWEIQENFVLRVNPDTVDTELEKVSLHVRGVNAQGKQDSKPLDLCVQLSPGSSAFEAVQKVLEQIAGPLTKISSPPPETLGKSWKDTPSEVLKNPANALHPKDWTLELRQEYPRGTRLELYRVKNSKAYLDIRLGILASQEP